MNDSRDSSVGVVIAVAVGVLLFLVVLGAGAGIFMYRRASVSREVAMHEALRAEVAAERARAETLAAQAAAGHGIEATPAEEPEERTLRSMTRGRETLVEAGTGWLLVRKDDTAPGGVALVVIGLDCEPPPLGQTPLRYRVNGEPRDLDLTGGNLHVVGPRGAGPFQVDGASLHGLAGRLIEGDTDLPALVTELTGLSDLGQVWATAGR